MSEKTTLTVRLSGALSDHVAAAVNESGTYENVSEYIRDLIRRDMGRSDQVKFDRLRAELQLAFSQPDNTYERLDAAEVIRRNQSA